MNVWEDRRALQALLTLLVGHGVTRFEAGGLNLEFAPPAAAPLPDTEPLTPAAATGDCSCGHDKDTQHGANGLCLLGCAVTLCEPATPSPGPS